MTTYSEPQKRRTRHTENIFLFIPNIIGYTRIITAIASLYYMPYHPRTCSLLYSISCLLDALDGAAARRLGQSTQFGAVLDMVTDRCTTTCLLVFLASAFPRWSIVFQSLIGLDYSSHYIHMYATLAMGAENQSHKEIDKGRPWVMRIYYTNIKVLFVVCTLNELFFIALYLLSFSSPSFLSSSDPRSMNSEMNLLGASAYWRTPWSAGAMEMARANKIDGSIPLSLLAVSLPVMLFKQYVNVIQLVEASKWLVQGDIQRRYQLRLRQDRIQ